jgi:hypothetical protein
MAVDPRGRDLKAFPADDPGGPVVMLNLLRFRRDDPDGGPACYAAYFGYQEGTHLRSEALSEAVLRATIPWEPAP